MFPSPAGTPVNLDALVVDVIRPALRNASLSWHGWHAFRRGLATTLHQEFTAAARGTGGAQLCTLLRDGRHEAHASTRTREYSEAATGPCGGVST
jgi:hypothetical protein